MKGLPTTKQGKVALALVLAFLVVGVVFATGVNGATEGSGIMVKLFLIFLGAILAIQVIPGVLLFSAMIKAISNLTRRESAKETLK